MTRSSRCATDPAPGVKAGAPIACPEHIRPDEVGDPAPRTSQTKRKTIRLRPRTDHSNSPRRLKSRRPTAVQIADAESPSPTRCQSHRGTSWFKISASSSWRWTSIASRRFSTLNGTTSARVKRAGSASQTNANNIAQDKIGRIVRSGIEGDPKALLDEGVCSDIAGVLDDYEKSHPDLASASQTHTAINHLKNHIGDIENRQLDEAGFSEIRKGLSRAGIQKNLPESDLRGSASRLE